MLDVQEMVSCLGIQVEMCEELFCPYPWPICTINARNRKISEFVMSGRGFVPSCLSIY